MHCTYGCVRERKDMALHCYAMYEELREMNKNGEAENKKQKGREREHKEDGDENNDPRDNDDEERTNILLLLLLLLLFMLFMILLVSLLLLLLPLLRIIKIKPHHLNSRPPPPFTPLFNDGNRESNRRYHALAAPLFDATRIFGRTPSSSSSSEDACT